MVENTISVTTQKLDSKLCNKTTTAPVMAECANRRLLIIRFTVCVAIRFAAATTTAATTAARAGREIQRIYSHNTTEYLDWERTITLCM
jgi:hypothetical protein